MSSITTTISHPSPDFLQEKNPMPEPSNINIEEVQARFLFAWEHTIYRSNLVALRSALGLTDVISLPVDKQVDDLIEQVKIILRDKAK